MKIGVLIATYNRPEYLSQMLHSLQHADLPEGTEVVIVDDHSTDPDTLRLIQASGYTAIMSNENRSIKYSLMIGCRFLFSAKFCTHICNLDSDAVVKKDFLHRLVKLSEQFPDHLITGFNCVTKNRNGSERHKILAAGEGYNMKASVGGINMFFSGFQYREWIEPALQQCLETQGNWDHQSCIRATAKVGGVICAVPSVVQHIGVNSSMGHSQAEPPDIADDFEQEVHLESKLQLPNVTLVGADGVSIHRLLYAIEICRSQIDFGDIQVFTLDRPMLPAPVDFKIHEGMPLATREEYSIFIMKHLAKFITTDYMLIIQHDGFVLNAKAWNDSWLNYDYIGAPWEWYPERNVGNGGFSLRSTRLMKIVRSDANIIPVNERGVTYHREEDHCICRLYNHYLKQQHNIKFAPAHVARQFSIEGWNTENPTWDGEFGFHGGKADISKSKYQRWIH